jgi:hypothetical protein
VPPTDVVLHNTADVKNGLKGGSSLTIKGKIDFGLDNTKCISVQYLCINVEPKGTAPSPYVDHDTSTNWLCNNINNMMTCAPGTYGYIVKKKNLKITVIFDDFLPSASFLP